MQTRPKGESMSPPHSTHPDATTGETGMSTADMPSAPVDGRSRRTTVVSLSDIQDTIQHPGTVRINVQGAFIVDDEPVTPRSEDYEHDPRDIRLPNHTAVVSHIAVDVSVHAGSPRVYEEHATIATACPNPSTICET